MSNVKASLLKAIDKLGRANGHKAPASQDPIDTVAHELHTMTIAESIIRKRRDEAKKQLRRVIDDDPSLRTSYANSYEDVRKTEVSSNVEMARGQFYSVGVTIKKGGAYVDVDSLKLELLRIWDTDKVNGLFNRHTKRRDPSTTYIVQEVEK